MAQSPMKDLMSIGNLARNSASRKIKVVMLTPSYPPEIGGVEKHVSEIAERLAQLLDVEVFTIDHSLNEPMVEQPVRGVAVKRFKSKITAFGVEVPPPELAEAICSAGPDILHLHSLHTLLPETAAAVISKMRCKLVITPHYHGASHDRVRNLLLKLYKKRLTKFLALADMTICVSEFERSLIVRDFQISDRRLTVIPNGAGTEANSFKRDVKARDPRHLLFVGRLEQYKNADKIVRALSLLADDDRYSLTVVGDGPQRSRLASLATKSGIKSRIELKSNLSAQELESEYDKAGVFVMPSLFEAHGIAVSEALARGLRVIVADTSALSEFVKHNCALGICPPVTPAKLARAIRKISEDDVIFKEYAHLSWGDVAQRVGAEYFRLAYDKVQPDSKLPDLSTAGAK